MKKETMANTLTTEENIRILKIYRSGWAKDIREGWNSDLEQARDVLYQLYEISGMIILALENLKKGDRGDKMAMVLTKAKLRALVNSDEYDLVLALVNSDEYDLVLALTEHGACNIITRSVQHHIKVMFDLLDEIIA